MADELGLDEADVRSLVKTFLESTEKDLLLLEQAYSENNADQLRQRAHHIKGAAGSLELAEISAAALAIEEKARSGIVDDPGLQIRLIRGELDSIRAQMGSQD